MSRRLTLGLAALATGLLMLTIVVADRPASSAWVSALLVTAAATVGSCAVIGAWSRPRAQSSADGSVAGPT